VRGQDFRGAEGHKSSDRRVGATRVGANGFAEGKGFEADEARGMQRSRQAGLTVTGKQDFLVLPKGSHSRRGEPGKRAERRGRRGNRW